MTETIDDSPLNKIISKTEKLAIVEKKYYTNWCDMPPEIKLECIGRMDFKMRHHLRLTARAENQLVDSSRYKFGLLYLSHDSFCLYTDTPYEGYHIRMHSFRKADSITSRSVSDRDGLPNVETVNMLHYVLKHCDFEKIYFPSGKLLSRIDFVKLNTVLKPRTITWTRQWNERDDVDTIIQFFKNCWDRVKSIGMDITESSLPLKTLFVIPSMFNARYVNIRCRCGLSPASSPIPLIEK